MEAVPIASFPFEEWALEVAEQCRRAGLTPAVEQRGPRAFHVSVPQEQTQTAEEVLSVLGYLTCSLR